MFPWCLVFGCPFQDIKEKAAAKREAEKDKELEWRRKVMIEEGINYGGSIYVTGQKPS
jgi:hypothetical protein